MPAAGVYPDTRVPVIVFTTINTKNRVRWLDSGHVHSLILEAWKRFDEWSVGKYVIMPDHVHFFAAPSGDSLDFNGWVKKWKARVTLRHGNCNCRWQKGNWDRRLRSDESYSEKWDYILKNPVRAGLVEKPENWPYAGEVHELSWW